jgi:spermidine/putrescine transport system permease protein
MGQSRQTDMRVAPTDGAHAGALLRSSRVWVLPALVWLFLLIALPLAFVFALSLARRDPAGGIEWVFGISNYLRAFDPLYLWIYWRSLLLALATTLICLGLGFPVAHFIAQQPSAALRNLLLFLVTLPFWTSFLIRTYAWILLLRTEGIINSALLALGIIQQPLPLLYNNFAILAGLVYTELPFMILPLYTVLEKIDKSQVEASADLGSTAWQTFWRVLVPLSRHGITAGVVLVFVPSVGAYLTPDLLGGAKSLMAGNLIHNQFAVVRDHPFGAAIAFVLTVVVLALLAVSYRATREHTELRIL